MDIQSIHEFTSSGTMKNLITDGVELTTATFTDITTKPLVTDPYNFQTGRQSFEVPFFVTVCIFGTVGNLLVIAVYKQKQYSASNAAFYILNLAVGEYTI